MRTGDVIADRFEILAQAGSGGMGEVFRARDRTTGEPVAIKVLRDAGGDADRFAREARLLSRLRHPGVVAYVAQGTQADGSLWLAMEWLDGEDLSSRLAHAPLGANESVELVRHVADALATAHTAGVVHRDVKPSNIFLAGLGIARALAPTLASRASTHSGTAIGTPGSAAPRRGSPGRAGRARRPGGANAVQGSRRTPARRRGGRTRARSPRVVAVAARRAARRGADVADDRRDAARHGGAGGEPGSRARRPARGHDLGGGQRARSPACGGQRSRRADAIAGGRQRGVRAVGRGRGRAREAMQHAAAGGRAWFRAARRAMSAAQMLDHNDDLAALASTLETADATAGAELERSRALWGAACALAFVPAPDRAARLAAAAGDPADDLALAYRAVYRGFSAMPGGDAGAFLREAEAAREHYERAGDRRQACNALNNVAYAWAQLGDDERAESTLRRALADARRMGLRPAEASALCNLGPVLARLGRPAEARAVEREAVLAFESQGNRRMEGVSRAYLAELLCDARDPDGARAEAERAVELFASAAPAERPYALAVLARAECANGNIARARAAAEEAIASVDSIVAGESTIRLVHAEVLRASGDEGARRDALRVARERLLARAARIGDDALRESFLTRVPEHARTLSLARECD